MKKVNIVRKSWKDLPRDTSEKSGQSAFSDLSNWHIVKASAIYDNIPEGSKDEWLIYHDVGMAKTMTDIVVYTLHPLISEALSEMYHRGHSAAIANVRKSLEL